MNNRIFTLLISLGFLLISSLSAFSIDNNNTIQNNTIQNYRSTIIKGSDGKAQKYSVLVATKSEPRNNSDFQEYYVSRVDSKYYQKGKIHVKTKIKSDNSKDNLLQAAGMLTAQLSSIGAGEIKAFANQTELAKFPEMKNFGLDRIYTIDVPADKDVFDLCAELMNNPEVEYACPVSVHYSNKHTPNDPLISKQYALEAMKLLDAWDVTKGSTNVKIAIVDSGTDYLHEDLAANIWRNPNEIPNNGIDDDGNGKIDDVNGWDFVGNTDIQSLMMGSFVEDNDPSNTINTHGTMTAGCASAATNNGKGIAGAGYNCKIIPVKIGTNIEGIDGLFRSEEAIKYAANLGADVINCSFGSYSYNPAEQDLINYVTLEKGSLIVAASGNESNNNDDFPSYPAGYRGVFSVGASNENNATANFSNIGYTVHSYAPGANITTTNAGSQYVGNIQGTSFSSPYVAGVAALVKSVHPDWTPKKIWHQLRSTSDRKITNTKSKTAYGIVNAHKAVTYNSSNSNNTVPGISVEEYYIDNNPQLKSINDNSPHKITIKIKNNLSAASNLIISSSSPENFVGVSDTSFTLATLGADAEHTFTLLISINNNNPWSDGYAMFVIDYKSGSNYDDYELIKVPVKVNTPNKTTVLGDLTVRYSFQASSAISMSKAWAIASPAGRGYPSVVIKADLNAPQKIDSKNLGNYPSSAICGVNENNAYAAIYIPNANMSAILKTENGGISFQPYKVSEITPFVNDIFFKDVNNGIFLGDPLNGTWGIATTNNAGATWRNLESPIASAPNESGLVDATGRIDDFIYFGSSTGKVYKSTNFGQNWQSNQAVSGQIIKISFLDVNNAMLIYRSADNKLKVANTSDGGQSWSIKLEDMQSLGFFPTKLFADRSANAFVIVNYNGAMYQSYNNGSTWQPILKHRNNRAETSSVYFDNNSNVSVFQFGPIVENIKYRSIKSDAKPKLAFIEQDLRFNDVKVDLSTVKKVRFENTGDMDATISKVTLQAIKGDAKEFTRLDQVTKVNMGTSAFLLIKLTPISEGEKEVKVIVEYDNGAKIETTIKGTALKADEKKGTISVVGGNTIDFGDITKGQKITKVLKITNQTQADVLITSISKVGDADNEIEITTALPTTVKANAELNLTFIYTGKVLGGKSGSIEINNNGEVNPIKITYKARVIDEVSVEDDKAISSARIVPNPAGNKIEILRSENSPIVNAVEIYSLEGKLMMRYIPELNQNNFTLNTSMLSPGTYNVLLIGTNSTENLKLIIAK